VQECAFSLLSNPYRNFHIAEKIWDKILQAFLTINQTGWKTGLGLSLAYDIVKAHGGEIKVVTKEGEGSEFIIYLYQA
jgi:two-component system NtrC family sensor kinase